MKSLPAAAALAATPTSAAPSTALAATPTAGEVEVLAGRSLGTEIVGHGQHKVKTSADEYLWLTLSPVAVSPSPKSQRWESGHYDAGMSTVLTVEG